MPKFGSFGELGKFLGRPATPDPPEKTAVPLSQQQLKTESQVRPEKRELSADDQALFEELIALLESGSRNLDENRKWRISDLFRDSYEHDVAFDVDRWLKRSHENIPRVEEIAKILMRRGYVSAARSWTRSLTPEGMKYGTGTRELRIEKAKKYAKLGSVDVFELAKEQHVSLE